MKITLSKNSGFCPGVKKAHIFIENLINKNEFDKIFTLGELIHNKIYTDSLEKKGVKAVDISEFSEILNSSKEKTALVIRTHGIQKEEAEALNQLEAKHESLKVFDLTCHHVKSAQKIAKENKGKTVACATHGGVLRCLSCRILHNDITKLKDVPWHENTAVSLIRFDDDFNPEFIIFNDNSHLPEEFVNRKSRLASIVR